MKRLVLEPEGWPCTLRECRPGFFVFDGTELCLKTEYGAMETVGPVNVPGSEVRWTVGHRVDAYNSAGERVCASEDVLVQPVVARWEEEDA